MFIKAVQTMSSKAEVFSEGRWDDTYRETQRDAIMFIHVLLVPRKQIICRAELKDSPYQLNVLSVVWYWLGLPATNHSRGLKHLHRFISLVLLIQSLILDGEYLGVFLALGDA